MAFLTMLSTLKGDLTARKYEVIKTIKLYLCRKQLIMSPNYSDLRSKTFLDFNPSKEALWAIIVGCAPDFLGEDDPYFDEDNYLREETDTWLNTIITDKSIVENDKPIGFPGTFKGTNGDLERMLSYIHFLDFTEDPKLILAIEQEFGSEYETLLPKPLRGLNMVWD